MQGDDGSDYPNYDEEASNQDDSSPESTGGTNEELPTSLGKAPSDYHAKLGETVTFKCPIINRGQSIVMWYKGDILVTQDRSYVVKDKRFELNADWSLILKNVSASDENNYTCQIVPTNLKVMARLHVIKPPTIRIIQGGTDVTDQQLSFREGERIRLDCESSDHPQPKFIWSLNGERLDKQDGVVVEKGELVVESAQAKHSDVFQCFAENEYKLITHKTVTIHVDCE